MQQVRARTKKSGARTLTASGWFRIASGSRTGRFWSRMTRRYRPSPSDLAVLVLVVGLGALLGFAARQVAPYVLP